MKIIEITPDYFPIIQNIANKTWPNTFKEILSEKQIKYMLNMMYSTESLTDQINNLNHKFLLCKDQEDYLGYASYELDYEPNTTKIHKIYILPDTQGKGLGKFLLNEVEDIAKNNNNYILSLNVNRFNEVAIKFYEHIGFTIISKENIDIGDGYLMEDYTMAKEL